jgi:hypothetical protein
MKCDPIQIAFLIGSVFFFIGITLELHRKNVCPKC